MIALSLGFSIPIALLFAAIGLLLWLPFIGNMPRHRFSWRRFWASELGMTNEVKQDRPGNARFYLCPTQITSGMPVLIGTQAAVALDAYDSTLGGTVFRFSGTFSLSVKANSQQSPVSVQAVNPGDELYANGTLDATTNITYNLTIDKTRGNCPFGNLDQSAGLSASSVAVTALVKLKEGGSPGPYGA